LSDSPDCGTATVGLGWNRKHEEVHEEDPFDGINKEQSQKKEGRKMENLAYWFGFILMGGIIGWLAGVIVKGRGFGVFGDIAVGVVGALVGSVVFSALGLTASSIIGAFIAALAGAVMLVVVTRFFRRTA
jgi:uncharacterized membrane protein YeaQ/YmgE (transglycosylase-associated protein family)